MGQRCSDVDALLGRGESGLDETEGRLLAQHLATCTNCRQTAAFMRSVHHVVRRATESLAERPSRPPGAGAFENVARANARERRRQWLLWPVAIALAGATALLVFWRVPAHPAPQVGLRTAVAGVLEGRPRAREPQPVGTPQASARDLLSRARAALALGDAKAARTLITLAEESEPERKDRAEAGTLRAESALLDRDAEGAIRFYTSVAERYPDLDAGEHAAFAAAQLADRLSNRERAQALFARYLEQYPSGRFANEARAKREKR